MKMLLLTLALAALTSADRLDKTYLPPPGASLAGGQDLPLPLKPSALTSSYLPPQSHTTATFKSSAAPSPFQVSGHPPAVPGNTYLPPQQSPPSLLPTVVDLRSGPSSSSGSKVSGYGAQSFGGRQGFSGSLDNSGANQRPVAIIKQANENNGDGTYSFSYETEDGIKAQEEGQLSQDGAEAIARVQGSYSYPGPDGVQYSVTYTADENGFQAYGDHLPTPPPIPEEIRRSLEMNAREEAEALRSGGQQGYQQSSYEQSEQQGYQYGASQQQGYPKVETYRHHHNNQQQQSQKPNSFQQSIYKPQINQQQQNQNQNQNQQYQNQQHQNQQHQNQQHQNQQHQNQNQHYQNQNQQNQNQQGYPQYQQQQQNYPQQQPNYPQQQQPNYPQQQQPNYPQQQQPNYPQQQQPNYPQQQQQIYPQQQQQSYPQQQQQQQQQPPQKPAYEFNKPGSTNGGYQY